MNRIWVGRKVTNPTKRGSVSEGQMVSLEDILMEREFGSLAEEGKISVEVQCAFLLKDK